MMKSMKSYLRTLAPVLVLSGFAAPALAQVYQSSYEVRPVQWFVAGGGSITQGQTADFFDNGWTVGGGVTFRPDPTRGFALQAEINYSYFGTSYGNYANQPPFYGGYGNYGNYGQTVTGFVDGVLQLPLNPWMRLNVIGGVGVGYSRFDFNQNGGYGCYPYSCGPGFGNYNYRDSTDFAWNAGLGMDFPLRGGQSWFLEARYERIQTQQPTEYIPIRIGFRF
jgi:hypothetical protein